MVSYSFKTTWVFESPMGPVWNELMHPTGWPAWWKGLYKVEVIDAGDSNGLGNIYKLCWGTPWIYTLNFDFRVTNISYYKTIEGKAHGDMNGTGKWVFTKEGDFTRVEYHWNVSTKKGWMNFLSKFLKPVFIFNHNFIMRLGGIGLARKLKVKLVENK
jgi:hypothetical protein